MQNANSAKIPNKMKKKNLIFGVIYFCKICDKITFIKGYR